MPPRLVPDEAWARQLRETFADRKSSRQYEVATNFPSRFIHAGRNLAVAYSSDKWKRLGDYEEYKHLSESPNDIFVAQGAATRGGNFVGPIVHTPNEMPAHAAELAPMLSIHAALFTGVDRQGRGVLPAHRNVNIMHIPDAVVFGARMPSNRKPFLFVATPSDGVLIIITGDRLGVEKDGIVG